MLEMASLPVWRPGEEFVNCLTHGIGFVISLFLLVALLADGHMSLDIYKYYGNVVFGITMCFLYLNSTVYHGLPPCTLKRILRFSDHISIYVFIAGTYTPMTLTFLRKTTGKRMLYCIWGIALFGTVIKLLFFDSFEGISLVLYLLMGWLICVSYKEMKAKCTKKFMFWLFAGGLSYTVGCYFYFNDGRIPYFHAAFHLFVMAGSFCHTVAILNL